MSDAPRFTQEAKLQTPIWLSRWVELESRFETSKGAKALRRVHGVSTLGDLMQNVTLYPGICTCHHLCMTAKRRILQGIHPNLDPSIQTPAKPDGSRADSLSLTPVRVRRNEWAAPWSRPVILDPDPPKEANLLGVTRIFGEPVTRRMPAYRKTTDLPMGEKVVVYTDSSADKNGKAGSACGAGIWSEDPAYVKSLPVPGHPPSNNRGEHAAVMWALKTIPVKAPALIKTDSQLVHDTLSGGWKKMEDQGWRHVPNADAIRYEVFLLKRRQAPTEIQKVPVHVGIIGNERADGQANAGRLLPLPEPWILEVPPLWKTNGARLSAMSFSDLYKRSLELFFREDRRQKVEDRITAILEAARDHNGFLSYGEDLWLSLRKPPFRKNTHDFISQAIHGRTVCGSFIASWGGDWTEKAKCLCSALESLQHILCECQNEWRLPVWKGALRILGKADVMKGVVFSLPTYDDILGVGLREDFPGPAARNHYSLVVIETSFVIWKLRNALRIRNEGITKKRAITALCDVILRAAQVELTAFLLLETGVQSSRRA